MPSWAWYSLDDVEVHVDLTVVRERHVEDHALAVLAHEIGHHLLAPVDWASHVRIAARVQIGLIDLDHLVGLVSNLWCDLLINDRLQRQLGVDRAALSAAVGPPDPDDVLMLLVLRTNEILWGLPRGALVGDSRRAGRPGAAVRPAGAGLRPRPGRRRRRLRDARAVHDPRRAAASAAAASTSSRAAARRAATGRCRSASPRTRRWRARGAPVEGPTGRRRPGFVEARAGPRSRSGPRRAGNALTPGALHAVLQALGSPTTAEEVAVAWYRANAARHLVPFPTRPRPRRSEELLAGLEPWEVGDDLSTVDWTGTVTASPVVVPGMTTVRRAYLDDPEESVEVRPVDLDLYLDSSGSMPDPRRTRAPIALAGAILALSALRAGARVQATTWSGPDQVAGTDGLHARRGRGPAGRRRVLRRVDGLPARPAAPDPPRRPCDAAPSPRGAARRTSPSSRTTASRRCSGSAGSPPTRRPGEALRAADGGGTLVLQVARRVGRDASRHRADGYAVHSVVTEDDLLTFVRRMAASTWGGDRGPSTR